jgi:hypothetical protein
LESSLLEDLPKTFVEVMNHSQILERDDSPSLWHVNQEIARSWAILFANDGDDKKKPPMHDKYSPLGNMPEVLQHYLKDQRFGHKFPKDYEYVLEPAYTQVVSASSNKRPISYDQFPLFEARLRQLRYYMDEQKPRGLRRLWKDNRDSLNYYTFWGVIIFGGLRVLLALFSLAVSIAQTVVSFRVLEGSPAPTSG